MIDKLSLVYLQATASIRNGPGNAIGVSANPGTFRTAINTPPLVDLLLVDIYLSALRIENTSSSAISELRTP